jgi:ribosomal protein S6
MNLKIRLILPLFLITLMVSAQQKVEKEVRIREKEVISTARDFVDSLDFNAKVRWYEESGISHITYEAKTRHKGHHYSIEFSKDGRLEDVEVEIKMAEIPEPVLNRMEAQLSARYEKYVVRKVQRQYQGSRQALRQLINEGLAGQDILKQYELVIASRQQKTYRQFEVLFSKEGEILKVSEIVLQDIQHLEY